MLVESEETVNLRHLKGVYPAEEAGKVFQMRYAPEIWVSRPENPAAELGKLGIHFVSDEEYNREVLIHLGVPETAVHLLPDRWTPNKK